MKLILTPIRHDAALTVSRKGDVLVVNGIACDLSKGQTCDWIIGTPEKVDGAWEVTLLLTHGCNAPPETLFPAVIEVSGDGPVTLPPHDTPEADGKPAKD